MSIHTDSHEVRAIALAAFPTYSGRKFTVEQFSGPMRLDSYWEGGSISYFVILDLATLRSRAIEENGTPFSNGGKIERITELPLNCAVVEHSIFCGRAMGIRIYVRPENLSALLPEPSEITREQAIVLVCTSSYKSSYRGISDYRFHEGQSETGITREDWLQAKAECIAKGLLRSNGSITDAGRNAIDGKRLWDYKPESRVTAAV